jgi:hypothetical protein
VFVALAAWRGGQEKTTTTAGAVLTSTNTAPAEPTSTSEPASTTTTTSPETATTATPLPTAAPTTATTATTAPSAPAGAANRPNPALTPGVADPAVTQANIHSTICVSGYTATVRDVSTSTKNKVYAEYGITSHAAGSYEVDHLISLELGGSNDIRNLWPEPYLGVDNAHDKDVIENRLHDEVCSGQLTLAQGQDEIVHWWLYE